MVDVIRQAFGEYGRAAIGLLVAIAVGLIGWNLIQTVNHSTSLATIDANSASTHMLVENLAGAVEKLSGNIEKRNALIEDKIGKIVDAQAEVKSEVLELQAAARQKDIDLGRIGTKKLGVQ
jgi:hypothetical protein